jgi:hypothetical protein
MNARDALQKLVDAFGLDDLSGFTPEQAKAIHDARNVLAVPDHLNRDLCRRIKARLDAQHSPKGVKRDRAAMELVMGAGIALEVTGDPRLQHWLIVCTMVASRGTEIVNSVAEGKGF